VGTSGFQFADWKGPVYPSDARPQDMLSFYEKTLGFNTVEVNYTYYSLPSQKTMEGMLKKTSPSFEFVVRSHKDMTHDIWTDKNRAALKNTSEVFSKFMFGIQPLVQEKRLGCVLLQFPYFFYQNPANIDYSMAGREHLKDVPLVVEFRNKQWLNEKTFEFLKNNELGFCVVDEPPLKNLMPAVFETTSSTGYFRLHGRNKKWFGATKEERYNYNYTREELTSFIPQIKQIEKNVQKLYIFFNNCYSGHAANNARMIKDLLSK